MRAHVLEQQLEIDSGDPGSPNSTAARASSDHNNKQPCTCPHLLRWLPHNISLDQIHGKIKNPVHALHLQADDWNDESTVHFGPEQVRLNALQKPGLAHSYCNVNSTTTTDTNKMAQDPSDMFVIRHVKPQRNDTTTTTTTTDTDFAEFRKRHLNLLDRRKTLLGKRTIRKSFLSKKPPRKTNPDISLDKIGWEEEATLAKSKVERWMHIYRYNRTRVTLPDTTAQKTNSQSRLCCSKCEKKKNKTINTSNTTTTSTTTSTTTAHDDNDNNNDNDGDSLLQCLECGFVACLPASMTTTPSKQHAIHHFLEKNHWLGVTCGPRARIYCFQCATTVHHTIFDMEHERIQIAETFTNMAWPPHPIQRSMDAFQFITLPEHGVVWKGIMASYPSVAPKGHIQASRFMMKRHQIMKGQQLQCKWGPLAMQVGYHQYQNGGSTRLTAPVGLYNLGNTCFLNGVLQCLIHCAPLQDFFLRDIGHDTKSCQLLRSKMDEPKQMVCLACELDTLLIKGFGSLLGMDVWGALHEPDDPSFRTGLQEPPSANPAEQGLPLIPSDLLTAAWKSGGMDHLAGYEQRDAHEFLQAFLDLLGKHTSAHHGRIKANLDLALPFGQKPVKQNDADVDIVKKLFEGSLRSVSICEECGCKRSMVEPFLNVSLPLSKHTEPSSRQHISVEQCLKQFTQPESLADPVDCPTCKSKTKTRKQHTFGRLPKILCLHLKRFDAAKNKKITDFVSFPAHDLDMGPLLPQWSELMEGKKDDTPTANDDWTSPQVYYDLFGTLNHTGSLTQGHYVANVKVGNRWFYCNDSGIFDTSEDDVVRSDGAYVLYYTRR